MLFRTQMSQEMSTIHFFGKAFILKIRLDSLGGGVAAVSCVDGRGEVCSSQRQSVDDRGADVLGVCPRDASRLRLPVWTKRFLQRGAGKCVNVCATQLLSALLLLLLSSLWTNLLSVKVSGQPQQKARCSCSCTLSSVQVVPLRTLCNEFKKKKT